MESIDNWCDCMSVLLHHFLDNFAVFAIELPKKNYELARNISTHRKSARFWQTSTVDCVAVLSTE